LRNGMPGVTCGMPERKHGLVGRMIEAVSAAVSQERHLRIALPLVRLEDQRKTAVGSDDWKRTLRRCH
jgi:hypothetical protein